MWRVHISESVKILHDMFVSIFVFLDGRSPHFLSIYDKSHFLKGYKNLEKVFFSKNGVILLPYCMYLAPKEFYCGF